MEARGQCRTPDSLLQVKRSLYTLIGRVSGPQKRCSRSSEDKFLRHNQGLNPDFLFSQTEAQSFTKVLEFRLCSYLMKFKTVDIYIYIYIYIHIHTYIYQMLLGKSDSYSLRSISVSTQIMGSESCSVIYWTYILIRIISQTVSSKLSSDEAIRKD